MSIGTISKTKKSDLLMGFCFVFSITSVASELPFEFGSLEPMSPAPSSDIEGNQLAINSAGVWSVSSFPNGVSPIIPANDEFGQSWQRRGQDYSQQQPDNRSQLLGRPYLRNYDGGPTADLSGARPKRWRPLNDEAHAPAYCNFYCRGTTYSRLCNSPQPCR